MLKGALVVVALATGVFLLVKRQIEYADTIGKTADALGVGIEFLQEFRFAATQAGVSTEAADKALGKLTKGVGELKVGTGSLTTFLRLYDNQLLATISTTKTTEEAYAIVFERLASMTAEPTRVAPGKHGILNRFRLTLPYIKLTQYFN